MGVRAMLTEAGRRAVVAWAFVAGIVTWRRARPDQVEASEKAAKRAWTQWDEQLQRNQELRPGMVYHMRQDEKIEQIKPVRVVPVLEVHRLIDEKSVLAIRRADMTHLLDYTWMARYEHARERQIQLNIGPLQAIRNATHDMLRRGVLHPGDERREVEVRLAREDGGSFTFTLDVNKPTWMVTARQHLEDGE